MRIIVLVALILTGVVVGIMALIFAMVMAGENMSAVFDQSAMMGGSAGRMRLLLLINHITMFLFPAVVWSWIYYKRKWYSGLGLRPAINGLHLLAGIGFLLVAYPIVAKSYEFNQSLHLPDWMDQMEGQTAELLKSLLVMESPGAMIGNVLVIAIIPGLGEELIFRGIIQKELYRYFKSPWVAVLLASVIFSAMHFQFAGFLPRFFLGMILGLLFYWTNNLWTSILVHAFNNAFQVIISYFNPTLLDQDFEAAVPVSWWALLASILLTCILGYWFHKKRIADPEIPEGPSIIPITEDPPLPFPEDKPGDSSPLP